MPKKPRERLALDQVPGCDLYIGLIFHTQTNYNSAMDALEIHKTLAQPETLQRLAKTVKPALLPGKRNLVYVLFQGNRIGHQGLETQAIRTLYEDQFDNIVILTSSFELPGGNPYVYQTLGDKIKVLPTTDRMLLMYGFIDGEMTDLGTFHLCLLSPQKIVRAINDHILAGGEAKSMILPQSIDTQGAAWLRSVGMAEGEELVLLHIRDNGYRKDLAHHEYRCATVDHYNKAIDACVDAGYWVFRIGDKTSQPLNHPHDKVVDVPFHDDYQQYLDVYLSAKCAFAINMMSGPEILQRAFNRPALTVNMTLEHLRLPLKNDNLVYKHFKDSRSGTLLSYSEVLNRKQQSQDPTGAFSHESYQELNIELVENSPEELEQAAREMIAQVSTGQDHQFDETDARFMEIGKTYEKNMLQGRKPDQLENDFYSPAYPFGHLSRAFLKSYSNFLD